MPKLIGIAIRPPQTKTIKELDCVEMTNSEGIVGDKRSHPGKRQVTLMSLSAWNTVCKELNIKLAWTCRRANLLVDNLPLVQSTGKKIFIGDTILEVTGETDPCKQMEEVHPGLLKALIPDWRGGVSCRVIKGGTLKLGIDASVEEK